MTRQQFKLSHEQARLNAIQAVKSAPDGYLVDVRPDNRTLAQNRLLWAMLNDLSKQVTWVVNGQPTKLSPEEWKDVATASAHQEARITQGFKGGMVMLGRSTSRMNKAQFADLINTILEFGVDADVRWSDQRGIDEWSDTK